MPVSRPDDESPFWLAGAAKPIFFFLALLTAAGIYMAFQVPISVFPETNFPRVVIRVGHYFNKVPAINHDDERQRRPRRNSSDTGSIRRWTRPEVAFPNDCERAVSLLARPLISGLR